ncbi:MAG: hypothetical protein ACRDK9_10765 [Solirubrobacterales bacterium]
MPDLEERTIETLPERCENCGATLTEEEKAAALDTGATPVLCTTCAAEQVPVTDDAEEIEAE